MERFFETLFGSMPDDHCILVWRKENKQSYWAPHWTEAVKIAERLKEQDVYVGCGVATAAYVNGLANPQLARCPATEIAGIPGFWLDVDLDDPAHAKANLPKKREDVKKLLDSFPIQPTIQLHSGHGYQFWWVFKEFWLFEDDTDRRKAADLSHRFFATFRRNANVLGFEIDMLHDLSRILRVPGTTNTKTKPHKPVKILSLNGTSCVASDIEEYVIEEVQSPIKWEKKDVGRFILDPIAEPPADKLMALCENEPRFKLSWEMRRKDFKDTSPSAYDFSLATFAFQADWSIQEVVNLIIAFRRKHNLDLKLRADYYERTVMKSRLTATKSRAEDNIDAIVMNRPDAVTDEHRGSIIANVSQIIGIVITRILKFKVDPPEYRLETPKGNIHLGAVQNLIDQRLMKFKLAAATGHYMNPIDTKKWPSVAQALLDACELVEIGQDSTDAGIATQWLVHYFQNKRVYRDVEQAVDSQSPFISGEGDLHFFLPALREFLCLAKEIMSQREMGMKLRNIGVLNVPVSVRMQDRVVTRSTWQIPKDHSVVQQLTFELV